MTEYTIDMIKGTTVMEQMRSLIKVVIDFINGESGDVEELRQMILTEIADRTAQDGQLQLQIQAEATARISQDNGLQSQIQTETSQRQAQVQQLTADIEYEQQTRQDSDDALETAIQTAVQGEADARQAQDATLQQALQNEVTARQSQDDTLQQGLQNEASARQSQDAQLSSDIQNEASQRASADSGLSHNITDLTARVGTVETSVSDIIQGTQPVGAAQNQGHADTQSEAQVGDHIVSTTANIGDDTHPVKIVNGVPVQVSGSLGQDNKVSKIGTTGGSLSALDIVAQKLYNYGVGAIVRINAINFDSQQVSGGQCSVRDFIGIIKTINTSTVELQCLSGHYLEAVSGTYTYWHIVHSVTINLTTSAVIAVVAGAVTGSGGNVNRYGQFTSVTSLFDLQT